jgi:hypothetical protein
MPDTMISDLAALDVAAPDDLLPIVDTSANETKQIAVSDLGEFRLSTTPVDLNSAALQTLYTVPAGKKLIVTRAVLRNGSQIFSNGGTTSIAIIRSNDAAQLLSGGLSFVGNLDSYVVIDTRVSDMRTISAGNSAQFKVNAIFEDPCTGLVDLFGYLVDA